MTQNEARQAASAYWWDRAQDALAAAEAERDAGRLHDAVNRAYYAAFYAASAVLIVEGHHFVKHTGVQAAVHRLLVHPGRLEAEWGKLYKDLFEARNLGDYAAHTHFTTERVNDLVEGAAGWWPA